MLSIGRLAGSRAPARSHLHGTGSKRGVAPSPIAPLGLSLPRSSGLAASRGGSLSLPPEARRRALVISSAIQTQEVAPPLRDNGAPLVQKPKSPKLFVSTKPEHVDPNELNELLLLSAKIPPRDPAKLRVALDHSYCVVALFADWDADESCPDTECPSGVEMVAFARATSDGAFTATLWDVCVHPDLQERGMGRVILERLMAEIRSLNVSSFTVFTPPETQAFFERCGFASGARIRGMKYVRNSIPDKAVMLEGRQLKESVGAAAILAHNKGAQERARAEVERLRASRDVNEAKMLLVRAAAAEVAAETARKRRAAQNRSTPAPPPPPPSTPPPATWTETMGKAVRRPLLAALRNRGNNGGGRI